MKLTERQVREMYSYWLLNECNCPIDEIEYLFDNLPKDLKKQIASLDHYLNNQNYCLLEIYL